jgi:hypothetical protein
MFVPDALFDHFQQTSSHVEIIESLVSARPYRQVMSEWVKSADVAVGRSIPV